MMRWRACFLVTILLPFLAVGCSAPFSVPSTAPIPGHMAPSFSLPEWNEGTKLITLNDLMQSKQPILLNAFASWCEPCQNETPDIVRLASEYAGKVQIVGVNMTQDDNVSDVAAFIRKFRINYPVLLDKNGEFMDDYNITGFPTTFLLNSKGEVIDIHTGELTKQDLQILLKQVL